MMFFRLSTHSLQMLGKETRLGLLLAAANLLLAITQFAEPVLFGRLIDVVSSAPSTGGFSATPPIVWSLLGAWIAFSLVTLAGSAAVALQADHLAQRQRQVVLTNCFEHVMQLPLPFHESTHSSQLMQVMLQGSEALWRLWLGFFREHFAAVISIVALLPLSLYINWRLTLPLFALCITFTTLTTFVTHKACSMQSEVEQHFSALAARASDALRNIALVQSFVRIDAEVQGLRSNASTLLSAQIPVLPWWAIVVVMTRAPTTITTLAIFMIGIMLHGHGLASIGESAMFVSFAALLIQKLEQVVSFINDILLEAPRLQKFFDVLDEVPAVRNRPDAIDPGRLKGLVEFNEVSFSLDGKRPAVEDLSFTALPGEIIALVGATGAGKSTTLALLHRAFDPQSGFIKIDGMDIRGLTLTALRRNIGVVFQESLLFNRSIADNLRIGKPDVTEDEMRAAAEQAQMLEFIEGSAQKFKTNVGEHGRLLSADERQRLSIARALLKNPPILILDEAANALNAVTEAKVNTALDTVMKGRTTFVIASRLSTLRNAAKILVFQNGRVIESGTFDELVAFGGHFTDFIKTQFMIQNHADSPHSCPASEVRDTSQQVLTRTSKAKRPRQPKRRVSHDT